MERLEGTPCGDCALDVRVFSLYSTAVSATSFTYDIDDVCFSLFEQHKIHERLLDLDKYADLDRDVYEATLSEAYKVAREVLHPINKIGDQQGCELDADGNVTTPDGFKNAWDEFCGGGWAAPGAPPDLGGAGMPVAIGVVLQEMFSGASMAFMMYPGLASAAARVIHEFGPEKWRDSVGEKMFRGVWGGTMCLTESGAGSSVGDNRCKATATDEAGVYLLEGEKIFITGGDHDMVTNICHMVLARSEEAPSGTKGLSLFLVPKFEFDDNLELGARNGAHVLKLEHKMGIKGSATCVLGLGVKGPCKAWLVGEECQGIELMFHMMNEARIGVGVQGLAAGSAAYQYSKSYAKDRVQGTSITNIKDANAPRVSIIEHPDVRRMLMSQKVLVETMRSLAIRVGLEADIAEHSKDEAERTACHQRVDLLVPILKSVCTDRGFDVAVTGVQVFGGYGYIGEYPVEQLVRDAKIQSIYEGTNGIQALDLLGRKMRLGGGKLFMNYMQFANEIIERAKASGFETEATAVGKALQNVGASAMFIASVGQSGKIDAAMLNAVPFLNAFGYVVLGVEALDQATVAHGAAPEGERSVHQRGKIANLKFFTTQILPQAVALTKSIQSGDDSPLAADLFD